ncbi:4-hydroxybenzoate 3-monooxygenase [Hyphomicrobium zavarzinii]|uniref:4-hydroxybenzoate 3-monooxygenase n=1 Tax=Hyphomicrobium zavarzinii TaxID=48292 RepID=UPI00036BAA3B|nr:4-hydroxybenzoate 3-monooxygenase [Hyphomicrobium zavarzinii]
MRTQVAIVGGGPSGLLLSQLLYTDGIDSVILEKKSREYVESRIRAGILEQGTVDLLARAGVDDRVRREGLKHDGFLLGVDGTVIRIDIQKLTGGKAVTVYGQTEVTKDLNTVISGREGAIVYEADNVTLHDIAGPSPAVSYEKDGQTYTISCDFVAGCDGYHGVSRASIPADVARAFEFLYPFGWLGILADVPPCNHELIYAHHRNGFALASMRSHQRSRYYIQVPASERAEDWPDDRLWNELEVRLSGLAGPITRGPALEKSIAPLRSFVFETMSYGRLFLAGDAAHIVPPTGAKGLNLAASDVRILADAFREHYRKGNDEALTRYPQRALDRIWKAVRFSWWLTRLTHRFPSMSPFDIRMQVAELNYIRDSAFAQTTIAENYVGLP